MARPRPFETALRQLAAWFERQKRILPWRENPETYRVWISEIMLQQTQVASVIPYFEKFMRRFPTIDALAGASEEEVLLHWAGLGYYSRARNIHRAAKMLSKTLAETGRFPATREDWLEVPGVGPYTAGAILSISMNLPEAILDGNVERVISRVRRVCSGGTHYKRRLWRLSRIFVERALALGIEPGVTNQALMELGATVCSPKAPKCLLCPLSSLCRARERGEEEDFPPRKKPKEWLEVREELHCFIDREGRVLLRKREPGEWRAGLWDLPASSAAPIALIEGAARTWIGEVRSNHVVTRHRITRVTQVWQVQPAWRAAEAGGPEGRTPEAHTTEAGVPETSTTETAELLWVLPAESSVPMGSALKKTLGRIRETFPEAWPAS